VLAHEIVVREVQRDSRAQVFDLLGKAVGRPRKPAHLHTHGQVLPRPGTGIPFPIMRGESPRGLDTELYGETNEKDSWGPRSLWPTHRFRVNSAGRLSSSRITTTENCTCGLQPLLALTYSQVSPLASNYFVFYKPLIRLAGRPGLEPG
jgi:hypothetical protein